MCLPLPPGARFNQRLEMRGELGDLLRAEHPVQDLAQRRHQRVPRHAQGTRPGNRPLAVLHGNAQVEADVGEPGPLGVPDQVTLVEINHGIGAGRLDGLIERFELGRQRLNRGDVVAEEPARIAHQHVDRLEHADPPAGSEHAVERPQRLRLVLHIDQDRPGGDHVNGGVGDAVQRIGRGQDEAAPVKQSLRDGGRTAVIEQVLGDVGEDHVTGAFTIESGGTVFSRWTAGSARRAQALITSPHGLATAEEGRSWPKRSRSGSGATFSTAAMRIFGGCWASLRAPGRWPVLPSTGSACRKAGMSSTAAAARSAGLPSWRRWRARPGGWLASTLASRPSSGPGRSWRRCSWATWSCLLVTSTSLTRPRWADRSTWLIRGFS